MPSSIRLLDDAALARALQRMALEIIERAGGTSRLVLVGIQRRGVQLAERLAVLIERDHGTILRGKLDITLYRDDLQAIGPRPVVGETSLPPDIDGATIVIVDDVLLPAGPSARRSTRSPTSAVLGGSCSANWWTAAAANCRSTPTSSG